MPATTVQAVKYQAERERERKTVQLRVVCVRVGGE